MRFLKSLNLVGKIKQRRTQRRDELAEYRYNFFQLGWRPPRENVSGDIR